MKKYLRRSSAVPARNDQCYETSIHGGTNAVVTKPMKGKKKKKKKKKKLLKIVTIVASKNLNTQHKRTQHKRTTIFENTYPYGNCKIINFPWEQTLENRKLDNVKNLVNELFPKQEEKDYLIINEEVTIVNRIYDFAKNLKKKSVDKSAEEIEWTKENILMFEEIAKEDGIDEDIISSKMKELFSKLSEHTGADQANGDLHRCKAPKKRVMM